MPRIKRRRSSARNSDEKDVGELMSKNIKAMYDGKLCKVEVLKMTENPLLYLVHYVGWNSRYDQWLPESKVFISDEEGIAKGKENAGEQEAPFPSKKLKSSSKSKKVKPKIEPIPKEETVTPGKVKSIKSETEGEEKNEESREMTYEEQRLENIRRNQQFLAMLNLKGAAEAAKKPKSNKIVRMKKPPTRERRLPKRRSLRVQGLSSDGKKLPDNFKPLSNSAPSYERIREEGTLEISASNKDYLKELMAGSGGTDNVEGGKVEIGASLMKYAERMSKMQIFDTGLVKVVKERIYSAVFHPGPKIMVAAGDKRGNLGFWRVGSKGENNGVVGFHPHGNVIAGLHFSDVDTNKLYSSSYDGHVRMLDLEKQEFSDVITDSEDEFYDIASVKGERPLYVSSRGGFVYKIDPREKKSEEYALHDNKIFTLSFNQAKPHEFCTASLDRTVRIWDSRKLTEKRTKPVFQMVHGLCVTGARYSPDGKYLVSCNNDCLLRIWNTATIKNKRPNGPEPNSQVRHDTRTGRWLTKFKCEWDPKQSNVFIVGSMDRPRCVEIFGVNDDAKASRIMRLRDDYVGSVQSINVFHETRGYKAFTH